ncbi:hypothetical protein EUTSA_v10028115mg [Eutrema salsugineum]|uniref:DUF1985 domain-containing protein n=1 Tax=Eutrema salsugineum TaxID=72664 RepID=V4NK34_EUTSA|nr:hypothetical protein EUTSA_v10028115mg [Eutrema salsugineum]
MVSGLKCSELEENGEEEDESSDLEYDWGDVENGHTTVELLDVLIETEGTEDNKDERLCLAMLILIESLVIPRAQNLQPLMCYPWGRDSCMILLHWVQKAVPSWLSKPKYDLHSFPSFRVLNTVEPPTSFLCEKYRRLMNPGTNQVVTIEGYRDVVCVLPSIQGDLEDTMFLEEKTMKIDTLVDIVTKSY